MSNSGPVLASVFQDLDGDGVEGSEHMVTLCGKSDRVRIRRPGTDLRVYVYEAKAGVRVTYGGLVVYPWVYRCNEGGLATTGTVTAVFSR